MMPATDARRRIDTAMARAVASNVTNDARFTRATDCVRSEGRAVHYCNRIDTTEARAHNDARTLDAHAKSTYMIVRSAP